MSVSAERKQVVVAGKTQPATPKILLLSSLLLIAVAAVNLSTQHVVATVSGDSITADRLTLTAAQDVVRGRLDDGQPLIGWP